MHGESDLPSSEGGRGRRAIIRRLLARRGLAPATTPSIPRRPSPSERAPLSPGQQRLWFLERLAPAPGLYVDATPIRLRGPLDDRLFAESLRTLVERHEILRTRFPLEDGSPVQQIEPEPLTELEVREVRAREGEDRLARVLELAREELRRPMDLERGPVFRARLYRLAEEDHVLLLVLHHMVHDGWSLRNLLRDLLSEYSRRHGSGERLDPLPCQYADFATWQQSRTEELVRRELPYWRERLADLSPTELPPDFERAESQSFRGATHFFDVTPTLGSAVARVAQSRGCTPFVVLLAAFLVVLYQRTEQDDLAIGTAFAGRGHTDLEELLGFFVNTVVLRTDLGGDPRFSELLRRLSDTVEEAARHQEMPFERLVEELVPERDLSRNALFQIWFNLVPAPLPETDVEELELELLDLDHETARLELALILRQTDGGYRASLEYTTDLYTERTIEHLAEEWLRTLAAAVADPALRLFELAVPDERPDGALEKARAGGSIEPSDCVSVLLAEQAAQSPGQIAVRCGEATLNYGQLLERADTLARELGRRLPGREQIVGLVADRSVHTPIGMLGVLRSGASYLPLDPTYPRRRLEMMLEEAGARAIVAGPESRQQADFGLPVIAIGVESPDDAGPPLRRPHLDELAYVMFTSGSSGRPKGVMVTRRNLAYSNLARRQWYGEPPARFLLTSSLSFDSSVVGLYWPLLAGGTLILAEEGRQGDPRAIAESIERHQVTHLCILPSLWTLVLEEPAAQGLTSLETVIVAGETCPATLPARHHARLPGVELVNEYGPTETTVWCSAHRCVPSSDEGDRVPIGRPIPGTSIRILDNRLDEVETGAIGEICVAGSGVARGYVDRPGLTAERFLPDPSGEPAGGRIYRTGDRGRRRDDGSIEFLGRADSQVKIRGHRVELEEIEAALVSLPGVREAAVCQREIGSGVVLTAFVTGAVEEGRDLRRKLESRLPRFMLPATIAPLDELPRTPSGKIDREALPEPAGGRADGGLFAAPSSPVERCLARLWCEVLGLERVGIDDSFFEVGGNSLRAAVIVNRFLDERREPLSLEMHLRGVTIRRIAKRLAEVSGREVAASGRESAIPAGDEALLARLDELSEEEVRETLRALLAERDSKS